MFLLLSKHKSLIVFVKYDCADTSLWPVFGGMFGNFTRWGFAGEVCHEGACFEIYCWAHVPWPVLFGSCRSQVKCPFYRNVLTKCMGANGSGQNLKPSAKQPFFFCQKCFPRALSHSYVEVINSIQWCSFIKNIYLWFVVNSLLGKNNCMHFKEIQIFTVVITITVMAASPGRPPLGQFESFPR